MPTNSAECIDGQDIYTVLTANAFLSIQVKGGSQDFIVNVPADHTAAEDWDFQNKGLRLYRYFTDSPTAYSNIIKTVELFGAEFTKRVPPAVAKANIEFMDKYTHLPKIVPRDSKSNLPPNEKLVHSGDAFFIMRLDGLNPMLGWAMGSTNGHVTSAQWIDGELFVVESTIDDSYWPTDHVQKTPYRTWLKQAEEADFQVVWSPLTPQARLKYNDTAALEFFNSVEGLNYGFKTMLWGWIDTAKSNFPCLPPDFSSNCLSWEFAELLFALVDRLVPPIGELMWNSAIAMRLGVSDKLRTAELYQIAGERGLNMMDVLVMPERDDYLYNTTRYDEPAVGKSMVCCQFVCGMWKAAGVFGSMGKDIQCGELTNWDDVSLSRHFILNGCQCLMFINLLLLFL
jgi:hypothetical protein